MAVQTDAGTENGGLPWVQQDVVRGPWCCEHRSEARRLVLALRALNLSDLTGQRELSERCNASGFGSVVFQAKLPFHGLHSFGQGDAIPWALWREGCARLFKIDEMRGMAGS